MRAVVILGVMMLASGALIARTDQARGAGASADTTTVPMLDYGKRPVVEATVNGKGPYRLILDTGASQTVINPEWVGGKTGQVTLDQIGIGSLTWKNVAVGSETIFGGTVPEDFPKGVLSAAAFPGYLVVFDYPNHAVTIRSGALGPADGRRIFQYAADEVLPMVPLHVAGHDIPLHVDTGSPGGLMLPLHYEQELPLAAEPAAAGKARTVAGTFDVFTAPVKGPIALGEYTLDVPSVRFSDLRPGPAPGPGNIGFEILHTFKITFDAANRRLMFER